MFNWKLPGKTAAQECKRPLSRKQSLCDLKRAREQINGWTKEMRPVHAVVIAVSATKATLNPGDKILPFYECCRCEKEFVSHVSALREKQSHVKYVRKKDYRRHLHAIAVSFDRRTPDTRSGEQFNFHHLLDPESPTNRRFKSFARV
jgi:hypothetical protein